MNVFHCGLRNSRFHRSSVYLFKYNDLLIKNGYLENCTIKNISNYGQQTSVQQQQQQQQNINKRLLEARNKIPNYPESLSCSQSDIKRSSLVKGSLNTRSYAYQQTLYKNPKVNSDYGQPCIPRNPVSNVCKDSSSSGSGGNGPGKSDSKTKKWMVTAIALVGCAGITYLWLLRQFDENSKKAPSSKEVKYSKIPLSSADIPKKVPYLLVGGGTASFSAFRAIKSLDPKAKVLVISNEYHKPYMRPPLSKELWFHGELDVIPENFKFKQWNGAIRTLYYEPDEFYTNPTQLIDSVNGGVSICQGYEVSKIDFNNKKAILTDGTIIEYDKCLIATGCEPKNLDIFESASRNVKDRVLKYRTPEDFEQLKKIVDENKSIVIIGSGFLGSELACAIAKYVDNIKKSVKIYQVFHENGNIAQALPEYLSKWTSSRIQEQGVCVIPEVSVLNADMKHNHLKLDLSNGQSILTDHVVMCLENEPNTQIAKTSGLSVDKKLGGFLVNSEMEAKKHLYVAGDAASFEDPLLGRRRIESHDHAVVSGRLAGENMAGKKNSYSHQAMFWSDLGPHIGFEGIGIIDSTLPTVGVFAQMTPDEISNVRQMSLQKDGSVTEEVIEKQNKSINPQLQSDYQKGVVFYLRDEKIVGILLWNLFNRISIARKIINQNRKYEDLNEVAKLFDIYS